ncbi:glycosyltransferase family 4 protein [Wenyingzhuangia sp. IMCC45574]
MRVLHIFNEIKFSGAEIMYANAAQYFRSHAIEMYALETGEKEGDFVPVFLENQIQVHQKALPNLYKRIDYINELVVFIRENNINILHIHRSNAKWLFALIAKKAGIKCVYTVHNVFKHRKITWFKGFLERYTARKWFGLQFQTIGQSVYKNELHYYKTPSIKVNNWYDNNRFYPATSVLEKEKLRKEMGISLESYVLISIGGCSLVKNHHDIIKAMSLLNNKDIIYVHLGTGATEAEEKELAKELGISDRVLFLGNKNNVRDFLIVSDVYLMPSRFEGLGMATVEAMACNIPVILYNAPGSRDLIDNNLNGLLIEQDFKVLAENINWMRLHREEALKMSEKALKLVNEEFDIEKNVNAICNIYRGL